MLTEQELTHLYNAYLALRDVYSYEDWLWGDVVPRGYKSAVTRSYNRFYDSAISLGYNMTTTLPECLSK